MNSHPGDIHNGGFDESFIDPGAIFVIGDIDGGAFKFFDKMLFEVNADDIFGQLNTMGRLEHDLDRLDPRNLVKEPSAAGVHEHRVTLHFQQF